MDIANSFNNHFSKITSELEENISDNGIDPLSYMNDEARETFHLDDVSDHEVVRIIADFGDAAAGFDNIPMKVIKTVIHEIVNPLTHIFNCSFLTGIFPDKLKISRVRPIFKKGPNNYNYRLISILPAFSKILEKLIFVRLDNFLKINNVISNSQYGFRKERSTTAAILSLSDHILKSFDAKEFTMGVFLDLSKAFDCVNHDILVRKLKFYGIRDTAIKLLISYLTQRQQYTCITDQLSLPSILTHSVPQGSILGPLLFNIYINDIVNKPSKMKATLFADDSCFYFTHKDPFELVNIVNTDLVEISKWLVSNKLTLNINKSHCILFNRKLNVPSNLPDIKIKYPKYHYFFRINNSI